MIISPVLAKEGVGASEGGAGFPLGCDPAEAPPGAGHAQDRIRLADHTGRMHHGLVTRSVMGWLIHSQP